jgi:hypothetical protein
MHPPAKPLAVTSFLVTCIGVRTQNEPQNRNHIRGRNVRSQPLHNRICEREDDRASCSEHAAELESVPLIGEVADNLSLNWIVRMERNGGRGCGHGGDGGIEAVRETFEERSHVG